MHRTIVLLATVAVLCSGRAALAQDTERCHTPERSRSRVVAMRAGAPRDSLRLRVMRLDSGTPLLAQARLNDQPWMVTDSAGSLVMRVPPRRQTTLSVRAIGFGLATSVLEPAPDSGLVALAVMVPMALRIEETCGSNP
jgi:hypothetical protein